MPHVKLTFAISLIFGMLGEYIADALHTQSCKEQKILQKSGLHEAPPKREVKECNGIFPFGQFFQPYGVSKTAQANTVFKTVSFR